MTTQNNGTQNGDSGDVTNQVMDLSPEDKKDAAVRAVQSLPADAAERKKDVANAAVRSLPADATAERLDIATAAVQGLTLKDRKQLASELLPDQHTANQIWLTIVRAFAVVFVLGALALFGGAFLGIGSMEIQMLLTVVTTMAGVLAGFISGRASTGETGSGETRTRQQS